MILRSKKGFLLTEVIIVTALTLLVGMAVWNFGHDLFFVSGVFQDTLTTEEDVRKALNEIVNHIRSASNGDDGSYPLVSANPYEITFFSDVDKDNKTEKVRYFLSGKDLIVGITKPTSGTPPVYNTSNEITAIKIQNIDNGNDPIFTYYDNSFNGGNPSTPLSQPVEINKVKMVAIKLKLDKNSMRAPKALIFETFVSIRNLKEYL
jgi:hypothetical protein